MSSILKRLEQLYSANNVPSKILHDGEMLITFPTLRLDGKRTQIQINIMSSMYPNLYRFVVYGVGKATNFNVFDKIDYFNKKHHDEMEIHIDNNSDFYLQRDIMFKLNPSVDDIHGCVCEVQEFVQNNLNEIKDIVGQLV